jgi:two-component system response regulator
VTGDRECITILLADDDEDDRLLTRTALEEARVTNDFRTVEDGVELIDYLKRRGRYADAEDWSLPGLILLDLNMPRLSGQEALAEIRQDPELRSIPVVALTTSNAEADITRVYELGANSYIRKPVEFDGLLDVMKVLGRYWLEIVELPPQASS